ncbi:MAG: hypothetical protein E7389_07065 [Ruminococcaceae bacterium]|nr:hypothetical protein [Oscillospiraceae bacterium]
MTVKEDLLIRKVAETVALNIKLPELDINSIVNSAALQMLEEIQAVLAKDKELEDFEIVEEIVEIFIKYGVDFKGCHDYY